MQSSSTIVSRFQALFTGAAGFYGTYVVPPSATPEENGKIKGRALTVHKPVTEELYARHLAGEAGLGVVPIREDSTCSFGALDIDVYRDIDHAEIARGLAEMKLPLIPCRSKSGGVHIFVFLDKPAPAARVQAYLRDVATLIGHGKCEIFPKQTVLHLESPESAGSWLNLPFHGCGLERCAFDSEGREMTLEAFLNYAEQMKVSVAKLEIPGKNAPDFSDGPPCLQALATTGGCSSGTRNKGMFAIGVYLRKAKPDEYKTLMEDFNQRYMHPPLPSEELVQIKKSVGRTNYRYTCNDEPLTSRCNAALCRFRKYGIGGDSTPMPQFGPLKKLDSSPPTYVWEIDGSPIPLNLDEIMNYRLFRRAVFAFANKLPPLMKEAKWVEFLQQALNELEVIPMPEDASPDGQLWEQVKAFMNGRVQALEMDEIVIGKPFRSADGYFYCRIADLIRHLTRIPGFKVPSPQEIAASLRRRGGKHLAKKLRGQSVNLWYFPASLLKPEDEEAANAPLSFSESIIRLSPY